jgi:hypothetical protein
MVLIKVTRSDMLTEDVILERILELLMDAIGSGCEDVIACERRPSCLDSSCQTFHYFAGKGDSLSEASSRRVIDEYEFRMENEVEFSQCMASRPVPAANSGSVPGSPPALRMAEYRLRCTQGISWEVGMSFYSKTCAIHGYYIQLGI